jgi:hypothetical protein
MLAWKKWIRLLNFQSFQVILKIFCQELIRLIYYCRHLRIEWGELNVPENLLLLRQTGLSCPS